MDLCRFEEHPANGDPSTQSRDILFPRRLARGLGEVTDTIFALAGQASGPPFGSGSFLTASATLIELTRYGRASKAGD